ncbi:tectonic [Episyrphus balteatus]|uniref:tectonic n=1 Tax=Episyrphus balteatus TaxID=286459 RepID=UPI0024854A09|nr:tectonic [Episyrphus balteatus]
MIKAILQILVALLLSTTIIESVKIGISKPVNTVENVTTETIETTTLETTTAATTTTTTVKNVQTTKSTPSSTPIPVSSTSATTSTTTIPPSKNDSQTSSMRNKDIVRSGYYCSCDLRAYFCDINCCCDIDCIPEELNSFDCHREKNELEDFNYEQGLPPCRINEGWLCVFRTNIDTSKNKHQNYIFDRSSFREWPQLLLEDFELAKDRSFYKIGEPILIYNFEQNEIIEFELPFSFNGHNCKIYESIRHLKSKKTFCHLTLEKAKHFETTLFQKLCTSFLLQKPNIEIPLDGIIKETLTEFVPITLFRCNQEYDCIPVAVNNSFFDNLDETEYSNLIETRLIHNITNLISCEVFFIQSEERTNEVWLQYEVKFVQINETQENTLNVSGPLGYTSGSPLIIGQKVLLNESAENVDSNRILSYFHANKTQEIHIHVPRRSQNQCKESSLAVNFGESILVQCSVGLDNSTELTSDTNFTKVCEELQNRSFKHFQVENIQRLQDDFFISTLGYPINKTDYWTKVEVRNYEHLPVMGVFLSKEDSFICQNMILGVKYEFLIVKDEVHGVRHQNLVKAASIEMGKRHDLQFQLDEAVSIPITFSTIFHDLQETNKAVKLSVLCIKWLISLLVLIYFENYKKMC